MSSDQRTSVIPSQLLERIFANLVNKSRRHASSRSSRRKPDAFRSLLRHMPEVTHDSTWEAIKPLVANKEEYNILESEEERIAVFDKVIRRLKEKRDEEKRYREREGSARVSSKRDREESSHRDGRRESRSRRHYELEENERSREHSRPRSRDRTEYPREEKDRRYQDRSRGYSRRDELDYTDEAKSQRNTKRRSDDDMRSEDRKVRPTFSWTNNSVLGKRPLTMVIEKMGKSARKGKSPIRSYIVIFR